MNYINPYAVKDQDGSYLSVTGRTFMVERARLFSMEKTAARNCQRKSDRPVKILDVMQRVEH